MFIDAKKEFTSQLFFEWMRENIVLLVKNMGILSTISNATAFFGRITDQESYNVLRGSKIDGKVLII